jgi:competence protein ComEC
LFIISVIAFIFGIYAEARYAFALRPIVILLPVFIFSAGILLRKKHHAALPFIVISFMLIGALRIGMVGLHHQPIDIDNDQAIYEGLVVEASPSIKIVKLSQPATVAQIRTVYRTEEDLSINDKVRVWGRLKELTLTYNNPHITSWKRLKRLEGTSYEIRGVTISVTKGKSYIEAWRNTLRKKIDNSRSQYTGIIKALTIGDTTGVDESTKGLFLRTGTSHILAISGSNIGIVAAFFFFLARIFFRISPVLRYRGDDTRFAALLCIPFAFMFMVTAGSSIPTVRATIMITVYMLSLYFERGRSVLNTIALSALIILLIYPHSIFMPTFQLTFASVLFIVLFAERIYPMIRIENRVIKWFLSSMLITLSAMLGTFPVVIYHFYGINPLSFIHNLISVPIMCIMAMPLGLVGALLPFGEYLLRLSGEILGFNIGILQHLDFGYIYPVVRPDLFEAVLYFTLVLSLLFINRKYVKVLLIVLLLPLTITYSMFVYDQRFRNKDLCFNVIDVGLGESILIEAPKGMRILIDGGGLYKGEYDMGRSILTPILLSKKIRTIDYVINTHPHGDHVGGLFYIVKNFTVKYFVIGKYFVTEERFLDIMNTVRTKGIPVERWEAGDRFTFNGMDVNVLNPDHATTIENPNNASLVLRIVYGKRSFLLTGDIESEIEHKLVLSGLITKTDVLKIPHHGSKYSSSDHFLNTVKPDIGALSVGSGIKDLPGEEALERYKRLSIPVLRTDMNGFIRICTDGENIRCNTTLRSIYE